jgi:cell division protein FtsW
MTIGAMLIAAGIPMRYLGTVVAVAVCLAVPLLMSSSYQRSRLTSFLNPSDCSRTTCFQQVQGQIALGSGGLFGVGLGRSVQKDLYLPEAQTDFILAVIGEELGVMGILGVVVLYGMIAFAGLRTARKAATRYAKLVATGLTSLILCQGILNIFVVLGIAPLTGVPLPFISYAPSSLCMLMASIGVLLNIARPASQRLRAVDPTGRVKAVDAREAAADRDRRRRDRGARRSGSGSSRRAAS